MKLNKLIENNKLNLGLSISLLLPLFFVLFVFPYLIKPNVQEPFENILGLFSMWIIMALLLVYILFFENRKFSSIGINSISVKQIILAIGIGLFCSLLVPALYYLMSFIFNDPLGSSLENVSQESPLFVLVGIITASVTEEVLVRAYPLERLYEITKNNGFGIILSLGTFVLLHAQSWNLPHIIGVVLPLGLILTFIYLKTRSLFFVIIVHFVIDSPLFVTSIINQFKN